MKKVLISLIMIGLLVSGCSNVVDLHVNQNKITPDGVFGLVTGTTNQNVVNFKVGDETSKVKSDNNNFTITVVPKVKPQKIDVFARDNHQTVAINAQKPIGDSDQFSRLINKQFKVKDANDGLKQIIKNSDIDIIANIDKTKLLSVGISIASLEDLNGKSAKELATIYAGISASSGVSETDIKQAFSNTANKYHQNNKRNDQTVRLDNTLKINFRVTQRGYTFQVSHI